MVVEKRIRGDVFGTPCRYIAFAVNSEGYNDAGFAGQVALRYWPELENTGHQTLGTVLRKEVNHPDGKGKKLTFLAFVCHSLAENGWAKTPEIVKKCLDEQDVPKGEKMAIVLMGAGVVGRIQGANVDAIVDAMDQSNKELIVYSL
jgi:hypothetical protein